MYVLFSIPIFFCLFISYWFPIFNRKQIENDIKKERKKIGQIGLVFKKEKIRKKIGLLGISTGVLGYWGSVLEYPLKLVNSSHVPLKSINFFYVFCKK